MLQIYQTFQYKFLSIASKTDFLSRSVNKAQSNMADPTKSVKSNDNTELQSERMVTEKDLLSTKTYSCFGSNLYESFLILWAPSKKWCAILDYSFEVYRGFSSNFMFHEAVFSSILHYFEPFSDL